MKAVRIHQTGAPDVLRLEEVAAPEPGSGQVQIRVAAAGVNYTDVMARQGVYLSRTTAPTMPVILGTEVAGVVTRVGPGVDEGLVGRRVAAFTRGGYAEVAVAPGRWVYPLPARVEFTDAVALLVQGVTAWDLLTRCARLERDETVLVHSAAGGVGTMAVQLAKALGAGTVISTASTPVKRDLATSLGADAAVDYGQDGWSEAVLAATQGRGVDVVLDAVGGDIGEESLLCLATGGRLVVYGVSSKTLSTFAGSQLMHRNQSVHGYWLTSRMETDGDLPVARLLELADTKDVTPVVRHVFGLADAASAHRSMADRATVGKVVLAV